MQKIIIYTDGGARNNPGPAGAGAIIFDESGKVLKEASKYLGDGFSLGLGGSINKIDKPEADVDKIKGDLAKEELVAEMTSAFVCAALSIVPTVRHTDYLASWLQVLKDDKRAIFRAASLASKAADFILASHRPDPDPDLDNVKALDIAA